jgi:23S rRNA (cytidine1920-2'-O)/16S rRNA (cytidine1409-2'-O)-methyltransferase
MEGTNARRLETLPDPIDLVVGDLSFISLRLILPAVRRILKPGGRAVVLVKPQFEAGREAITKGGRLRSDDDRTAAIDAVRDDAAAEGFEVVGGMDSPVAGAKAGNIEHFLSLRIG